ncbi:5-oxoprolinase subunit PxpB [Methylobrevis pamukkalensis]|uniref:Kinase A inhibitor n=1 Tax=Methylobrevis pamukkalensis TaxID=1439726 RepID=A0A1E3H8L8_9HYPH|nr:5-oxoprolinase subunit PxpB [Methylobrevis pamukkalensis]ODN72495.1 Kinase A inhibitor [Methylobrevis pamukkalensis]
MTIWPRLRSAGDRAITIEFSDRIDDAVNAQVVALGRTLADDPIGGVEEWVPTYRSLLVLYDPGTIRGAALGARLMARAESLDVVAADARHLEIPVVYGGAAGLDLGSLAAEKAMAPEDLVALHAGAGYRVHMIGFAPGFAYLGGLPEALHAPRLAEPRQRVAAGAVGIGGRQAGINSVPGPSGWRYIGRTPLRLFDPARAEPFLLRAGDRLRFRAIGADEAAEMDARIAAGEASVPDGATS